MVKIKFEQLYRGDYWSLTVKSLTNSSVEQLMKRPCGNFSNLSLFYFYVRMGIGIPVGVHATSAPPPQSTEQLPAGF